MPAMPRVAPTADGRMIRIVVFRICCLFVLVVGTGQGHSVLEGPVDGTAAATVKPRYVVHTGTLLAEPDKQPLPRASLLIQGDLIVAVRPGHVAPADFAADAQLIDLASLFVLPGLIDSQVHFTAIVAAFAATSNDCISVCLRSMPRLHRIKCIGFGINRDDTRKRRLGNPRVERFHRVDCLIGVAIKRRDYGLCSRFRYWATRFLLDQLHRLMIGLGTLSAEFLEQ